MKLIKNATYRAFMEDHENLLSLADEYKAQERTILSLQTRNKELEEQVRKLTPKRGDKGRFCK